MIEKKDRIKDESNVSRHMQQQVPKATLDGSFDTHAHVTQFDTSDKDIIVNLLTEDAVIDSLTIITNADRSFSLTPTTVGKEIIEPTPTSNLTQYNKVKSIIDRDGHVFLFDYTTGNARVHLRHPTGTYWTINNSGDYTFKVVDTANYFYKGKQNTVNYKDANFLFKKHRDTNIILNDTLNVNQHQDISIGGIRSMKVGNTDIKVVGKHRIISTGGYYSVTAGSYVELNARSMLTLDSKDVLIIRGRSVSIKTGRFQLNTGSFIESAQGVREIAANALNFSSSGNAALTVGGNYNQSITGVVKETINGNANPPDLIGKHTKLLAGDWKSEILSGNIIMLAAAQGIDIGTLLAKFQISVSGDISMSNSMGSVKVGITGITEVDGTVQVKLGGGGEALILGNTFLDDLFQPHQHGSAIGPTGSLLPSYTPKLLTVVSYKVFTG